MNYRETNRFGPQTSLGMNPRLERVLAYAFFWVSGLILFFVERKDRSVRWHAAQSMVTFGLLFLLMFGVSMLSNFLSWIPILGGLTSLGLGLLMRALGWIIGILWVWLMINAWFKPDYRLPIIGNWIRYLV
ncbi:MAG TPA: hypothetical protein VKU38_17480 [Ktedonobacteraceae bacterium]|nr:hypothetical protein [Ktedonobacteraceae bacterium]